MSVCECVKEREREREKEREREREKGSDSMIDNVSFVFHIKDWKLLSAFINRFKIYIADYFNL